MTRTSSTPAADRRLSGYRYLLRCARSLSSSKKVLHLGSVPPGWLQSLRADGFVPEALELPQGGKKKGRKAAPSGGCSSVLLLEIQDPARLPELIRLAHERLADGGVLIVETPNPESGCVRSQAELPSPLQAVELRKRLEGGGFAGCWIKRVWTSSRSGLSWKEAQDPRLRQRAASQAAMHELKSTHEGELLAGIGWKGSVHSGTGHQAPPVERTPDGAALHWATATFRRTGYATLARGCIQALDDAGVPQSVSSSSRPEEAVAWFPDKPRETERWKRLLSTPRRDAPCVIVGAPYYPDGTDRMALLRMMNPGAPAYVGLTMFETDRLPGGWKDCLDGLDEIWVPSRFNQQVFISSGIDERRVQLVPFGVDPRFLADDDESRYTVPNRRRFAFLSVFLWSRRKGPDVLLDAYTRAFKPSDDVCLILRCIPQPGRTLRQHVVDELARLGRKPGSCPLIILLQDFIPESAMPALYRSVQAFVLPSRGEGLGLPYMEAMATGLPVIGTRWGAQLDFMEDSNSFLIENRGTVPVGREATSEFAMFEPDHRWADPSVDHLVTLMRQVYSDHQEAQARGGRARDCMRENWTMQRTVEWMKQRAAWF